MSTLPTGPVTFFFSDIEGSTKLLEALGEDYDALLERHHQILREAFERCTALEIGTEGDSFLAVFPRARDAVTGAVAIQRALADEPWPGGASLRIRIGLHTGEARIAGGTYVGLDLHRAARIMAAARGGQILVSDPTRALVERTLGDGIALRDLGEHRLRDLSGRERLFEVVADGLPASIGPPRTLDTTPNNLPTQPSMLVGRELELRALRDRLESADVRLLTLTGPGGIGKTRLAVQVAAEESHRFADGVYFVDLSSVRDADGALQALVEAVGPDGSRDEDLREALAERLAVSDVLLVLDNFEQVVEAAQDVAAILRQSRKLKILVTSREGLKIRAEQVFPVAPLSLPDRPARSATADDVARSDAVRLFVQRAQQVRPSFLLTDENAGAVAEICARLDGLPLALELAAARLELLSPEELLERLRRQLEVLRGVRRDLPARHQTLRSTIEWSYELLDEEEQRILQLVALFPSARTDAVEAVAATLAPLEHVDVLERLGSLVDKSLVRSVEDEGRRRLSMLGTIREFALEELRQDAEFHLAARRAHAEYFSEFAAGKRAELDGRGREGALAALGAELGNLQAAWAYFVEQAELARLSSMLDTLWAVHDARGWYRGAVALTGDLLDVLSRASPAVERADEEITLRMSVARGLLALRGYTQEVEELFREALALAETSGALPKRLPVLKSLASFYLYRGEIDKTIAVGREVLALAEKHEDTDLQVEGDLILGPALVFVGENAAGMAHLDRAITVFDPERHGRAPFRVGPNPGVVARVVSGLLQWIFGYPETAARRAADALELGAQLGHPYSLAYATFHVGLLDLWSGRLEVASARARAVLTIADEHEYRIWRALGLVLEGVTTAALGRSDEGLARTEEGVSLYENLHTPPIFWAQVLGLHAEALRLAARPAHALALLDRAAALSAGGTWESAGVNVQRGEVLAALGETDRAESVLRQAFREAESAGARMTQLRAATGIARLAGAESRPAATAALRQLLESMTEGFETPHVLEARAVLGEP